MDASPSTDLSLSPMFRTVSIIPGIENLAPDLTDTRRGSSTWPRVRPISFSRLARCSSISPDSSGGSAPVSR